MEEFEGCFADLDDPRDDNARHALNELLMIALCAVLCGAEDCSDMALFGRAKEGFLWQCLRLRHGIPSHDTFSRVFRLLDTQQLAQPPTLARPGGHRASSPAAATAPARPPPRPPITCSAHPSPAERFGAVARQHWGIENSLHWVLDVTMNEDHTRNRKDNGHKTSLCCGAWHSISPGSNPPTAR